MNVVKKCIRAMGRKSLAFKSAVSTKWYCKSMNRHLRRFGVNLTGTPKFIARDVKFDSTDPSKISIGEGTVITSKVTVLVHDYSIECGLVAIGKQDPVYESMFLREVKIGDNVFIGQNAFIKPGTVIGNNCIIGAGAVVGGVIPEDSVVIGNPGKVVCSTKEWAEKKYSAHEYRNGSRRRK